MGRHVHSPDGKFDLLRVFRTRFIRSSLKLVSVALVLIASCGPKMGTLEDYEKRNPYPGSDKEKVEYASRGSLMPKDGEFNLFTDTKARKVGDVIFVQVVESLNVVESVATQTQRSASVKEGISSLFDLDKDLLDVLSVQGSGQMQTQSGGRVQQSGVLTTRLAGRVMKVYPNGTMLIEAKKNFYMDNAQREMVLRGIVRREDIDTSNVVTSDKIANLEVFIDGKGFLADGGSPGWLARILAKLLPF